MARPALNRIWANSNENTRRDPGNAKYSEGWTSEIPTYQVLNFLQWKTDTTLLAIAQTGIPEWGGDVAYVPGAIVFDATDRRYYSALVNNPNSTMRPSLNSAQWALSAINLTSKDYTDAKAKFDAHVANTNNPHNLTAAQLDAYTKAECDALITQYRALVAAHANDKNNPHKVTAAQIGAVPITGGTYVGQVTFQTRIIALDATQNSKIISDDTGMWLAQGTGRLGLRSGSEIIPMVGTTTQLSRIVTDTAFASYKSQTEQKYAVPEPDFLMHLVREPNIAIGGGLMDADWDWRYRDNTGWLVTGPSSARNIRATFTENPLAGCTEATIAVKFKYAATEAAPFGATGNRLVLGWGLNPTRILIVTNVDGSGRALVPYCGGSAGPRVKVPDAAVHTVVVVRNGSTFKMYLDGVAVTGDLNMVSTAPIAGTTEGIGVNQTNPVNNDSEMDICDYRSWRVALTPEQISQL